MGLPIYKRLSKSDAQDSPAYITQLFSVLNNFAEGTINLFDKGLVIGPNVQGMKINTVFTTPADYATGGFTQMTFNYTSRGIPNCLLVGQIVDQTGAPILTPVTVTSWYSNINVRPLQITIDYIAGLAASKTYSIVLVAL